MTEKFRPETLRKGEWMEVTDRSAPDFGAFLEEELTKDLEEHRGMLAFAAPEHHLAHASITRILERLFKNGLKDRSVLSQAGGFRFRFLEPSAKIRKEIEKGAYILAIPYEIELHLTPRYKKDGMEGEYRFTFLLKANDVPDDEGIVRNARFVRVWTTPEKSAKEKTRRTVKKQAKGIRTVSGMEWAQAVRIGLKQATDVAGPSLGKKK
jgi:hypothetical protein